MLKITDGGAYSSRSECLTKRRKVVLAVIAAAALVAVAVALGVSSSTWMPKSASSSNDALPPLPVPSSVLFGQTHLIPPEGITWDIENNMTLRLVGKRQTLFLFELPGVNLTTGEEIIVFGHSPSGALLGSVQGNHPEWLRQRQRIEDNQTNLTAGWEYYSATLPAQWIVPGFGLSVSSTSFNVSEITYFHQVGMDIELTVNVLPMWVYGANESHTGPFTLPAQKVLDELYAKWPVSKLTVKQHPIGNAIKWGSLICGPRNGNIARVLVDRRNETFNGTSDGFTTMSIILGLLGAIRGANGETSSQHYTPMYLLSNGQLSSPGGGLGGGSTATGDGQYSGIFIHEIGHGLGLPHAGGAFPGSFPYTAGSLLNSVWAYDSIRQIIIPNLLAPTSGNFAGCKTNAGRIKDALGRCVKQDYMQGGAGDQSTKDRFTIAADYNIAKIQRYFEGTTSVNAQGVRSYSGGQFVRDANSLTGWSRWDSLNRTRIPVQRRTTTSGQYGLDSDLPYAFDVPVHTVIVAYSLTEPEARRIYPVLSYSGNLKREIDPFNATELAWARSGGEAVWYCVNSGCDFTLRMTYMDGSVIRTVVQAGYRSFYSSNINPNSQNPLNGASFMFFGMNFPGTKQWKTVELLDTPRVTVTGYQANATVLLSLARSP